MFSNNNHHNYFLGEESSELESYNNNNLEDYLAFKINDGIRTVVAYNSNKKHSASNKRPRIPGCSSPPHPRYNYIIIVLVPVRRLIHPECCRFMGIHKIGTECLRTALNIQCTVMDIMLVSIQTIIIHVINNMTNMQIQLLSHLLLNEVREVSIRRRRNCQQHHKRHLYPVLLLSIRQQMILLLLIQQQHIQNWTQYFWCLYSVLLLSIVTNVEDSGDQP